MHCTCSFYTMYIKLPRYMNELCSIFRCFLSHSLLKRLLFVFGIPTVLFFVSLQTIILQSVLLNKNFQVRLNVFKITHGTRVTKLYSNESVLVQGF